MARVILRIFLGTLVLLLISAAPSEITLDITQEKNIEDGVDIKPVTLLEDTNDNEETQGQRQKRWYNFYGLGYPSTNPIVYKRDEGLNTGVYGYEDPFIQIHRKLQEINSFVRQPALPPLPPPLPQFPSYLPVIYLPHYGCACTPDAQPNTPTDKTPPTQNNNQTTDNPDVFSRWPAMEDERQNWGFVLNDTDIDDGDDGDGSRPISFEPIRPMRPINRPPPPVEHGSSQGDVNVDGLTTTTTMKPAEGAAPPRLQPPTACDGAILSCCHMPQVTFECFAVQGCPDPSSYGNPCDSGVILRVVERFQKFYNQRNG